MLPQRWTRYTNSMTNTTTAPRDYAAEILAAYKIVHDPAHSVFSPEVTAATRLANRLADQAWDAGVRVDETDLDEQARCHHYPDSPVAKLRARRLAAAY